MATKIWVVANATTVNATFVNTEHAGDEAKVPAGSIVHTGGSDKNFCRIPDCSGSQYYAAHHMAVTGTGLNVSFWNNDDQNHLLYYSVSGTYEGATAVAGSDSWDGCMLLISGDISNPRVVFGQYDLG